MADEGLSVNYDLHRMQSAVGIRRHAEYHHSAPAATAILIFTCSSLALTIAQQATQFLPDDVPQVAQNVTERLSYRQAGFQRFWQDPHVQKMFLAGEQLTYSSAEMHTRLLGDCRMQDYFWKKAEHGFVYTQHSGAATMRIG